MKKHLILAGIVALAVSSFGAAWAAQAPLVYAHGTFQVEPRLAQQGGFLDFGRNRGAAKANDPLQVNCLQKGQSCDSDRDCCGRLRCTYSDMVCD